MSVRSGVPVIRGAVVALVCAVATGTLWGLSAAVGTIGFTEQPTTRAVVGEQLPELTAGAVPVAALQGAIAPQAAPQEAPQAAAQGAIAPQPAQGAVGALDPVRQWADATAGLVPAAPAQLVEAATAEINAQAETPGCRLSWVTVAAVVRAAPDLAPDEVGTALCAEGRDTGDEAGWTDAVRSIKKDTAFLHRVLAIATSYADAVRTGVPINPAAAQAIDFAVAQIGLPYVWGGNGPQTGDAGFDCSGLTTAAYATADVTLPRTAHTQYFATDRVQAEELLPGDLIFYGNPATKVHHVGMYLGNGLMVNAPTFGKPVQVAPVVRGGSSDLSGAGRPA